MITLYVLKGNKGKRYVGITNDLNRRIREHRSNKTKGSQVIGEFTVLHTEEYTDHKSARKREKFLKSGQGRKWLDEFESRSEPARDYAIWHKYRRVKNNSIKEACAPMAHSNPPPH